MVKIEKKEIKPVCPFCERKLERVTEVKRGFFQVNRVFCCPYCHKILGFSAGQG